MKTLVLIVTTSAMSATLSAQAPDFTPLTPLIDALLHEDRAEAKRDTEKAIALLQKSSAQFSRGSGCASCDHRSLPQMALAGARAHDISVDEDSRSTRRSRC